MSTQNFIAEIREFLLSSHLNFIEKDRLFYFPDKVLTLIPISAELPTQSYTSLQAEATAKMPSTDTVYLYEDRWRSNGPVIRMRLLARSGKFRSIFARKCKVVSINNLDSSDGNFINAVHFEDRVAGFLEKYHSYGYLKSPHIYALLYKENIVAVATFSAPKIFRDGAYSFEWTRYATLPDVRIAGGMGKLLSAFIKEVHECPIEIMSYSDNEWNSGKAYIRLGFEQKGERSPVLYHVNKNDFHRLNAREYSAAIKEGKALPSDFYTIENKGSKKFILKIFN